MKQLNNIRFAKGLVVTIAAILAVGFSHDNIDTLTDSTWKTSICLGVVVIMYMWETDRKLPNG